MPNRVSCQHCRHFTMKTNSVGYFARSNWSVSATELDLFCGMPAVCKQARRADTGALPFSSLFDPRALNPKLSQWQNGASELSASYPLIDHLYFFPLLVVSISFLPGLTRATQSRYSTSYVRSTLFHPGYPPACVARQNCGSSCHRPTSRLEPTRRSTSTIDSH